MPPFSTARHLSSTNLHSHLTTTTVFSSVCISADSGGESMREIHSRCRSSRRSLKYTVGVYCVSGRI
jgi:hypothetical protein